MKVKSNIQRSLTVFVMAFAIILLLPIAAKAEIKTGNCGASDSNVKYSYNTESKKMTIYGTGEMKDYDGSTYWGWPIAALEIQAGVTSVGANAFYDCDDLASVTIANTVLSIGEGAFKSCDKIEEITLPSGVQSVGDDAFRACEKLKKIKLPDTVSSLGERAFYYCAKLQSVKLPNNLKKIENETFYDCTSLASAEIPEGVTGIGNYAFAGCTKLTSIEIPGSVKSMGEYAFSESGLTRASISEGVPSIGYWAFSWCSNLTSVTIPSSVTSIGASAFVGCSSLGNVEIPDSVTSIGANAFAGCTSLGSVEIPNSVANIGEGAFLNCYGLKSVRIPNSVGSVGDYAFGFKYSDLKYELIPEVVVSCNQGSAAEIYVKKFGVKYDITLSSLPPKGTNLTYNGSAQTGVPKEDYYTVTGNVETNAGTYTATVTLNDGYKWSDGTNTPKTVEWAIMPASITLVTVTFSNQAYTNSDSAVTPEPTVKFGNMILTKDKDYTVAYEKNTNPVTLTITGMGNFTGTTQKTTTLPVSTGGNGNSTASPTSGVVGAEVKNGATVKDDKTNAYYMITSTENNNLTVAYALPADQTASILIVPDTVTINGKKYKVTEIKANAFKNNKKLKKITIGKNIKKIGKNAFSGCKNLKNVTIKTTKLTKKKVGANAFKGIHAKAKVKVPKSKLKSYKTILKARGIKGKNQKITK